jgi:biotin transporter BioY
MARFYIFRNKQLVKGKMGDKEELASAGKSASSFYNLLTMGLLPFIPGDIVKVLAAAGAAWALTPKKDTASLRQ